MNECYLPDGGIDKFPYLEYTCDEDGDYNICSCNEYFRYDPKTYRFFCPNCGIEYGRYEFLNYIGAKMYSAYCLVECNDNYPMCRDSCPYYMF